MTVPKRYVDTETECEACGSEKASTHPDYEASACPDCGHRWASSTAAERALTAAHPGARIRVPDLNLEMNVRHVVKTERTVMTVDESGTGYRIEVDEEGVARVERFEEDVRKWMGVEDDATVECASDPWVEFGGVADYEPVSQDTNGKMGSKNAVDRVL